jgi:aspartyl-tRNA synthetase
MESFKRTVTCGALRSGDIGTEVTLNGWVHRNRDFGGIQFIILRDRYGLVQAVVDADAAAGLKATAAGLKYEYCVAVVGTVRAREAGQANKDMETGEIEVKVGTIEVLNTSETLPFMVDEVSNANEDLRLKYRYLDLRSFSMQKKLKLRHEVAWRTREYLINQGFFELETPTLIRSTPEGARDYLVPSRIHSGKFYALPQSPQLYKQLLMVGGMDKYFQIARCYRDEDARGDRQPEFTQIDIEMSFVGREDVFKLIEGMFGHIFRNTMQLELPATFQRLAYDDAIRLYGSDKPELRFGWEMQDADWLAGKADFSVFKSAVESGGAVRALVAKGCGGYSRKQITELEDVAKIYKAKGLAWMKVVDKGAGQDGSRVEGGIAKFFAPVADEVIATFGAESGDLLLFVADGWKVACTALGAVRLRLGRDLKLCDPKGFAFAWIIDFPLFEYNEDEQKWDAAHHLFSMPQEKYLATMEKNPGEVKGDLYDLVCNGYELASGSIRITSPELQQRVFSVVGIDPEEGLKKFGFLMEAFKYGAPPHGGIAPGLDRLVMIMAGENSIREVIAFPKNTVAVSPMDECPAPVDQKQLNEIGIAIRPKAE